MLDLPLCEEILPYVPSKPLLSKHEAVFLSPITCLLRKEIDTLLAATSFLVVVVSNELSFYWMELSVDYGSDGSFHQQTVAPIC